MKLRENTGSSRTPKLAIIVAGKFLLFFKGCIAPLQKSGFEVSAISSPGSEQETIREEGATTIAVPMNREISPLEDLVSLWRLWRVLRRIGPAITNSGNPKAGLLGGLAAVLAGVPCRVYALHGLRLETTTGLKKKILLWTEKLACKCAHRVICDSPSLRQRAIDLGLVEPSKALVFTCHGVEVDRYLGTRENLARADSLRRNLSLPKGVPVIGFVGRLTRDKGIPELMEAYAKLRHEFPDLRLLLVGEFEDGDAVPLNVRRKIEDDPLVVHPGLVADTSAYYQLMDVLALPTWREGFGLVNIEAQAAGKPVVTTCATGAIDSILDGETGILVPVGDAVALANALHSLLVDSAKRHEMGRKGQVWVSREFSRNKILASLAREYHNLIAEQLGSRADIVS